MHMFTVGTPGFDFHLWNQWFGRYDRTLGFGAANAILTENHGFMFGRWKRLKKMTLPYRLFHLDCRGRHICIRLHDFIALPFATSSVRFLFGMTTLNCATQSRHGLPGMRNAT